MLWKLRNRAKIKIIDQMEYIYTIGRSEVTYGPQYSIYRFISQSNTTTVTYVFCTKLTIYEEVILYNVQ